MSATAGGSDLAGSDRICPSHYASPFDSVTWTTRDVKITDRDGRITFQQNSVECPERWSEDAVTIAASKYFFGLQGTPERETSVRQLIERVAFTIAEWGRQAGHFVDTASRDLYYRDLAYALLHQYAAFNSPVWFNVGLHQEYGVKSGGGSVGYKYNPRTRQVDEVDPMVHPQASACFILKLRDSIDSVWDVAKSSARLFKYGSGVGADLSPLRSKYEPLSGGGRASGPLSFGKVIDVTGGTIKSGGRTRRAAIMLTLKDWHPEFPDFIRVKAREERKVKALIKAGYDPDFNGEAYGTVAFQNANLSARVTNAFMEAAEKGDDWQTYWVTDPKCHGPKLKADEEFEALVDAIYECGDPGVQFEDTIQKFHTCPNTEAINSSNPCSEFKFLDDTSCNLASLRLTAFLRPDGTFDVELFVKVVRVVFRAQEILVGSVSYPTPEVASLSYQFRPLGIGYADLGALIMLLGLAYDSDEGRALCSGITALMTGEAYALSAEMARDLGTFEGFAENRNPMLNVMALHRQAALNISPLCPEYLRKAANDVWEAATDLGKTYGYRNAQASVLAPTGTISFMMDCATTSGEPELGLVKFKKLAGGGHMKLVNPLVTAALTRLGYDQDVAAKIKQFVIETGGTEGCPDLKPEHAPVFDTAFPKAGGTRCIHWRAHIGMMVAAQPFISGAISKTVNVPRDVSKQEIADAIREAWRKELKAVAIYRDGSKWSQPLSTSESGNDRTSDASVPDVGFGSRVKLPNTRDGMIHHFRIGGHDGYITVGLYPDGSPGEVFVKMSKSGSTVGGLIDSVAIAVSIGLQHGVPLELFVKKFEYVDFEPRGMTGNPDVPLAKSVVDYVFRWLGRIFIDKKAPTGYVGTKSGTGAPAPAQPPAQPATLEVVTGPPCTTCGAMTQRSGSCYYCRSCGSSSGGCG